MGTCGIWGFVIDGEAKTTYNHSDSYPSGLGDTVLRFIRETDESFAGAIPELARKLRVIKDGQAPTAEDIDRLKPWTNLNVSEQSTDDWYGLLRETQGKPAQQLASGYMLDDGGFAGDSLFCEWGYLIDLDSQRFEVYRGLQQAPHDHGRYATLPPRTNPSGEYYPIRLIASWPLSTLPERLDEESLYEHQGGPVLHQATSKS